MDKKIINPTVIDTRNKSEEDLNSMLSNLPPIVDVKVAGDFLIVACLSLFNETGAWKKYYHAYGAETSKHK